jgi:glycosyltransferase involved in cell wall biosynthesis
LEEEHAMNLLFLTGCPIRFTVATPGAVPLGGTESSVAYLARQLAARGHAVTLVTQLPPHTPEMVMGVRHAPLPEAGDDPAFFAAGNFDAVIAVSCPILAPHLRQIAPRALQVHWIHMMPDQPNLAPLRGVASLIDCAVFVSEFQRAAIRFPGATQVIGNGIAPAFENMFASAADLKAAKQNRAAYTSTPFRGLDVLAQAFPLAGGETQLDVYSGMAIYHEAETRFAALYEQLRNTPRCHMHGPLGQDALAGKLRPVSFLAYPSIFTETYCIAALEAIAAGLRVVSTDLGALKETTLGFADLLPLPAQGGREALAPLFAAHLKQAVDRFLADRDGWAEERFAQACEVSRRCAWSTRAQEWEAFLGPAIAWKRGL